MAQGFHLEGTFFFQQMLHHAATRERGVSTGEAEGKMELPGFEEHVGNTTITDNLRTIYIKSPPRVFLAAIFYPHAVGYRNTAR